MKHSLRWFVNRIGKRIFRRSNRCGCHSCKDVFLNGLVVADRRHADYLFTCQNEMNLEYYDKRSK